MKRGKKTTKIRTTQSPIMAMAYYRPPSPPLDEWERDFANIKKMGFDGIQMWIYWGWYEQKKGEFDFSEIDLFFDTAEKNGLMVIPQIVLEVPPGWLEVKNPLQSPKGVLKVAHLACIDIPCYDDQEVRRAAEPFIEALVSRYKSRDILHWCAWNEHRSRWACCCDASRKSYGQWLEEKYSTIDAYNKKFGKCFHDWTAAARTVTGPDYAVEYNWRLWAADSLTDQVRWVADIIKRLDPDHPAMGHAGASSVVQNVRRDTCVDALMCEVVDLYGSSCAAGWESQAYATDAENVMAMNPNRQSNVGIQLDWLRSLSPESWIHELYADHFCSWITRDASDLMWQFWQIVSRGLGGIKIWEYKVERIGKESLGYGLVGLDGEPNDRSRSLEDAMKKIKTDLAEFFATYQMQEPVVGVLYDERSHLLGELEEGGYFNDAMGYGNCGRLHSKAFTGVYETLRRLNIPVTWVPWQRLDEAKKLKALILPGHGLMDSDMSDKLEEFVKEGGILLGQAGTGFRRDNTYVSPVIPAYGLSSLFGIKEDNRTLVAGETRIVDSNKDDIDRVASFAVKLKTSDAEPIGFWEDGSIALTKNEVGKGSAWYLGAFSGLDCSESGGSLSKVLGEPQDSFLKDCGTNSLDVIPWQSITGSKKAYFIFNTTDDSIKVNIPECVTRCDILFGNHSVGSDTVSLAANSAMLLWMKKRLG